MVKDTTLIFALILAVVAGSFAGSALAVCAIRAEMAAEMTALRAQVEPSVCRLFATGGQQP